MGLSVFKKDIRGGVLSVELDTSAAESCVSKAKGGGKKKHFPSLAQLMDFELTGFN